MSKREEFIAIINALRTASASISDEQRKGLLRIAVQQHSLTVDEATDILTVSGLSIGERVDYFNVLGLDLSDLDNRKESEIVGIVEAVHKNLYSASLAAGGRPRADGRTEEQWRTLLNQARETLTHVVKRDAHIAILQNEEIPTTESIPDEEIPIQTQTPSKSTEQDGMVLIPAGEFQMGCDDYDSPDEEKPMHSVYIDAFYIDKYPVTNAQYKEFIDANPQWRNLGWYDIHLIVRNTETVIT